MNPYPANRLASLDAFRGATIAGMLLANNPGSWGQVYPALRHAAWHGWTPTDMIFPGFLWIMGVAMTLSWARRVEAGEAPLALFRHVGRRAAIIFGLGLLLGAFPFGWLPTHTLVLEKMRIPGVLQRIGVCYAAAGAICLWLRGRGQVAWVLGLLVGSAALLKFFPVPGYGAGHIDEAVGNLAWWIDAHVLAGHTWSGAPAPGFDPEGIFSTFAAIATVVLGAWAGRILRAPVSGNVRAARLLGAGLALGLGGLMLERGCGLPINKNLWTSSFALFMAGASSVGLAVFYWVIDVRAWRRWAAPLVVLGVNAIVIFVGAGVVARLLGLIAWSDPAGAKVTLKTWIYARAFTPYLSPLNASLGFAVAFVAVFLGAAWLMWRKRWIVKI